MPSELVGVAGFEPAAPSSRTALARVQVGWSEVSTLIRALQAVMLTASERAGPRAVAPILLPESDTLASGPRARPRATSRKRRASTPSLEPGLGTR
jgi:hypothetical protein